MLSKIVVKGVTMKKLLISFLIVMIFAMPGCGKKNLEYIYESAENEPDCVVCSDFDGEYHLTVIAKKNEIEDKELFARELIERVRDNSFKSILFSYDEKGYPIGLQMTVYLTEEDWHNGNIEPYIEVKFRQENILNGYNIVEHFEQFRIEVE